MTRKLLFKFDMSKFEALLRDPASICRGCSVMHGDCIGISECYPDDSFSVIEYTIRAPNPGEIDELVKGVTQ